MCTGVGGGGYGTVDRGSCAEYALLFSLLLTVIRIISNFSLTQIMGFMVNMAESTVVKYKILAV